MPPEPNPQSETSQTLTPSPLKQIRTFQGDIAQALATQNESLYSLQAKEHARGTAAPQAAAKRSALPLLLGSLLLLALAGAAGWLAYGEFTKKTTPPAPVIPESRFLSAESEVVVDAQGLSRDSLVSALSAAAEGMRPGELRHLDVRSGTTTESIADFFATLNTSAPGSLIRAFEPVFMAGALGVEGSAPSFFLIIRLDSYENAFGGMLAWEATMPSDVGPLFASAGALQALGASPVFKDVAYKNKDARVLYTSAARVATSSATTSESLLGEAAKPVPALLYSFFGTDTLVITDRLETLDTLLDRLTQERLAR
jgi:hypothetical protein